MGDTEEGSSGSIKKTVSLKTAEYVVIDNEKQKQLLCKLKTRESVDLYKQMLMESWSVHEVASQKSLSIPPDGLSSYEVVIKKSSGEQMPIVGYAPIYALRSKMDQEKAQMAKDVPDKAMTDRSFGSFSEMPDELMNSQSYKAVRQLFDELNSKSMYATPFDKFVPHENLLPDLDPSIEATLLSQMEEDPVRGIDDKKNKEEEERYEKLLNYPDFEETVGNSREIKMKIQENMEFWRSISPHVKVNPPTEEELKLLDYGTLCNMYMGNWGFDEDNKLIEFFYKFQYDDVWRDRLKNGCFNLLDECIPSACGICQPVTNEEMATMKDEHFFEIEDKEDYENVVVKIREEFNKGRDQDSNWDFHQLIMNPVDSDLDDDPFITDEEIALCPQETPSTQDWINAKVKWEAPKKFDVRPNDEEDLLAEDSKCENIELLKYKKIIPKENLDVLQSETIELMKNKLEMKKADEKKGIFWRPKTNYLYQCPDFRRRNKKAN